MRLLQFHTHWHPHHDDVERGLLLLYLLIVVVAVTWGAWHMLSALSSWGGDLFKPEPMQFGPY
jgi:hypothetical protein